MVGNPWLYRKGRSSTWWRCYASAHPHPTKGDCPCIKWLYRIKRFFKVAIKMALTTSCTFHTTTLWMDGNTTLGMDGPDFRRERPVSIQWLSLHLGRKCFQEIGSSFMIIDFFFYFNIFTASFFLILFNQFI